MSSYDTAHDDDGEYFRSENDMTPHVAQSPRTTTHDQRPTDAVPDDAICILDTDGFITSWSLGAQLLHGYCAEEIIGRNFSVFFTLEDARQAKPAYSLAILRQGGTIEDEGWRVRKDGSHFRARDFIDQIRDRNGRMMGYVKITRELDNAGSVRQAHVTDDLRTTNALLRRAEAMTHVGHWRLDLRTRVMHWSDEMFRIFGLPTEILPSLEVAIASHHAEDRQRLEKFLDAMLTGTAYLTEARIVQPGGAVRHVSSQGAPEYDANGTLVALFGTFRDRTERYHLESGLRQSQRLEAIGRVSAGVAHDFNNVLQGIIGGLEMITDPSIPTSEQQNLAHIAMNSARRGVSITSGLLSYACKQPLQPVPVMLAPVLGDLGKALAPMLPEGMQVVVSCEADCPMVEVDVDHLRTALHHLAINAMHAMLAGGTLTLQAQASPSGVTITVSDTGCGMDAATLSQAFEPFFTTKGASGNGLGLSMVQGFACQSGGAAQILSTPGRGTQVEIRLPAIPPETRPSRSPTSRVLLIDDDADVLLTAAAFLQAAGFEVIQAGSADAAKSHLKSGIHIDALVTDYSIPGMSGIDLIVYARGFQPDMPALLITGYTDLAESATLPGAVQVLGKPFRRNILVASVKQLIEAGAASSVRLQAVPS